MVVLREFETGDASRLRKYLNNLRVTRFLTSSIPQPYEKKMLNGGPLRTANRVSSGLSSTIVKLRSISKKTVAYTSENTEQ